jgi:hypothetical protein
VLLPSEQFQKINFLNFCFTPSLQDSVAIRAKVNNATESVLSFTSSRWHSLLGSVTEAIDNLNNLNLRGGDSNNENSNSLEDTTTQEIAIEKGWVNL